MNLEQQCVSLELAKKLKELGVKQESLYWWSEHTIPATLWAGLAADDNAIWNDMQYSAFTVAELDIPEIRSGQCKNGGYVAFMANMPNISQQFSPVEADARAKLLVYLLENKLI